MQIALLHGEEIIAWELDREGFDYVRHLYRQDKDCLRFPGGLHAVPRGGPQRINHFAHRPGESGVSVPETIHHIQAKRIIREVALRRGWAVTIEARHPSGAWQADVLVEKEGQRVAFEVQWSPQSVEYFQARTVRYAKDEIETIWLARSSMRSLSFLPIELNVVPLTEHGVGSDTHQYSLELAIGACFDLLEDGTVRSFAEPIYRYCCYRCDTTFFFTKASGCWQDKRPFTEEELAVLGKWAGKLRRDYSNTLKGTYQMWHCPHCRAKQGDFYFPDDDAPQMVANDTVVPYERYWGFWSTIEDRLLDAGAPTLRDPTPQDGEGRRAATRSDRDHDDGDQVLGQAGRDEASRRAEMSGSGDPAAAQSTHARPPNDPRLDQIREEGLNDKRPVDEPARLLAMYERTSRAADIHRERSAATNHQ